MSSVPLPEIEEAYADALRLRDEERRDDESFCTPCYGIPSSHVHPLEMRQRGVLMASLKLRESA